MCGATRVGFIIILGGIGMRNLVIQLSVLVLEGQGG
jgi:hypothetical protein